MTKSNGSTTPIRLTSFAQGCPEHSRRTLTIGTEPFDSLRSLRANAEPVEAERSRSTKILPLHNQTDGRDPAYCQTNGGKNKSKCQKTNSKTKVFSLVFCALLFVISVNAYALNLDKARTYFLKDDYEGCINECENILAQSQYSKDLDELYYLLGLSYLKTGDYLRSFDVFDIIIKEFTDSFYKEDAALGKADIYFLKEDYKTALAEYQQILRAYPNSRLKPLLYFRLAQTYLKSGSWQQAKQYTDRLVQEYPLSFEKRLYRDISEQDFYFTVQVGAFSKQINAQNLCQKLIQQGYPAFIQEVISKSGRTYRVRVGKLNSHFEAKELEKRLIQEGYPTHILP